MKRNKILFPFIPRKIKNAIKDSFLNYFRQFYIQIIFKRQSEKFFGQTSEDAILAKLMPDKKGFYVDIGCGHPIKFSNTFLFYKRGWKGICVDPISLNTRLFKVLRRRDFVLNSLVGTSKTKIDFWEFEPYGLSTSNEKVAKSVLGIKDVRLVKFSKLEVLPLSQIVPELSFELPTLLSVDVEGMDLDVLKSNDWNKFRPHVICIEEWRDTKLNKIELTPVEIFLTKLNYEKISYTGLSSIYINKDFY
jgi:FkbM family methyltransferase